MRARTLLAALSLLASLFVAAPSAAAAKAQVPRGGVDPMTVEPSSIAGSYRLDETSSAIPLRSRQPDWVTPELLTAARVGPTPIPAGAVAPDVPLSGYVGIRPGSEMVSPYGCTMNFVFKKSGVYAIGTAGHCVDKVGQPVTILTVAPGTPPSAANLVLVQIGTVVSRTDNGIGADFALVSIKPALQSWVFPTEAVVAGPCGAYTADGTLPDVQNWNPVVKGENPVEGGDTIYHYGHGVVLGTGGTPRGGAATAWTVDGYYWVGAVIFGDSGSAARIQDLKAAGDVTHLVVDLKYPAYNAGTRITKMLSLANGYSLVNSPYCV